MFCSCCRLVKTWPGLGSARIPPGSKSGRPDDKHRHRVPRCKAGQPQNSDDVKAAIGLPRQEPQGRDGCSRTRPPTLFIRTRARAETILPPGYQMEPTASRDGPRLRRSSSRRIPTTETTPRCAYHGSIARVVFVASARKLADVEDNAMTCGAFREATHAVQKFGGASITIPLENR